MPQYTPSQKQAHKRIGAAGRKLQKFPEFKIPKTKVPQSPPLKAAQFAANIPGEFIRSYGRAAELFSTPKGRKTIAQTPARIKGFYPKKRPKGILQGNIAGARILGKAISDPGVQFGLDISDWIPGLGFIGIGGGVKALGKKGTRELVEKGGREVAEKTGKIIASPLLSPTDIGITTQARKTTPLSKAVKKLTKSAQGGLYDAWEKKFKDISQKVEVAEKTPSRKMSKAEIDLWQDGKNWKEYSKSRGYSTQEVADFQKRLDIIEEGKKEFGLTIDDVGSIESGFFDYTKQQPSVKGGLYDAAIGKDGKPFKTMFGKELTANPNGTITVYHRTSPEIARKIEKGGLKGFAFEGKDKGKVFFSTNPLGGKYIGSEKTTVLKFEIDPRKFEIDELWRDETFDLFADASDLKGVKPLSKKIEMEGASVAQQPSVKGGLYDVYHGTNADFTKFDPKKVGSATDEGLLGKGTYFSTDPKISAKGQKTLKSSISIKKPLNVQIDKWSADKSKIVSDALGLDKTLKGEALSKELSKAGYDGVILDYSPLGYKHQEMMVLDTKQIGNVAQQPLAKGGLYDATDEAVRLFGESKDIKKMGFIDPKGRIVDTPDNHEALVDLVSPELRDLTGWDKVSKYVDDTSSARVTKGVGKASDTLFVEAPSKLTDIQLKQIERMAGNRKITADIISGGKPKSFVFNSFQEFKANVAQQPLGDVPKKMGDFELGLRVSDDALPGGYKVRQGFYGSEGREQLGEIIIYDKNGKMAAGVDYGKLGDEINVKMIETQPAHQRKGLATFLNNKLKEMYPDLKIDLGMTTPEGTAFTKAQQPLSAKGIKTSEDVIKEGKRSIGTPRISKRSVRDTFDKLYTNWVNKFYPIEKLVKGKKLVSEADPRIAIKRLLGAGGTAELRHRQQLKPILNKVDIAEDNFDLFLKAKRDIELAGREIKGSDKAKASEIITALGEKYDLGKLDEVAEELYAYQSKNLDMLRESGFLDEEAVSKIFGSNKKYVPFTRVMDDIDNYLGLPTSRAHAPTSPIQKIKGSARGIESPLESIVKNTYKTEAAVAKNRVARSIANLSAHPEYAGIIKKVNKASSNTISAWENGSKVYYQVPSEISNVVKGLNEETSGLIVDILSVPAKILRQGATGRNPAFMLPNIFRDQFDAAVNAKYGYIPFLDYFRGLAHVINYKGIKIPRTNIEILKAGDDLVEQWINSGGKIFFESMSGMKPISKQVKDVDPRLIRRLGNWATGGLDVIGELSETPTRVGVFRKALKATGDPLKAALESREATLDFARMGAKMKVANSLVPFLNVGVQGFDRMVRTLKNNPKRSAMVLAAYAGVPQLMVSLYNNLYHSEDYGQVPDFEKEGNFVIMTGSSDKEGKPTYIKIPKGHIQRLVANPTDHLITWLKGSNPQTFSQLATAVITSTLPVVGEGNTPEEVARRTVGNLTPQAIKPFMQQATNYDLFRGREIVPWYMQDKPPSEQVFKSTPALYKKVGDILNMSPLDVKNFAETSLAGYAKTPANLIETMAGRGGVNQLPVARRFVGSYSGFDIDRPEEKEKEGFISRLLKPTETVGAVEDLPARGTDLEVLYKDAVKIISGYPAYSAKIRTGLKDDKTLVEAQDELLEAKSLVKQIEEEHPEQVFNIELDTYKSGGGMNVEERSDWVYKKLNSAKDKAERIALEQSMLDNKVITKSVLDAVREKGLKIARYSEGGKIKSYTTKIKKGKKPKKVTFKKVSMKPVKFGALPSRPKKITLKKIPGIKIVQPKQTSIKVDNLNFGSLPTIKVKPLPGVKVVKY